MQGRYEYYCSVYEPINNTVKFDHCLTRSNINVRAVCPGSTRHPFHTFNQRRSTQSRHRHCSVFGHHMYVRLRPHTALINNIMCIKVNYYKRTRCSSRDNATSVPHTFIERSSMQNRHCHCSVVYKDGITTSYCIEHQ